MPARLSSLLVRDGLVGVKRMEKAFQRQVIYGGSLDTILLEMALVSEERLTQYLALASGLPPAAREEAETIEPKALALISPEIAAQFRAVPLTFDTDGEALRVLVCSPLEINELEDLADLLDRPLQPLITPECRWHIAYARAYHVDAPARFTTLARTLAGDATPEPVGRPRSVIVDDVDATKPMVAPPVVAAQPASPIAPVAAADDRTDKVIVDLPLETKRSASATLVGVEPARRTRPHTDPGIPVPRPPAGHRGSLDPIATAGRDSPLAIVRARELLATADDRDTVFLTLLRAARARARYAGLLTVQGGAAIGRVALAEIGIDIAAITKVLIPLDAVSPFRAVVQNQQPHIGPLVSGDDAIDGMAMRFGGTLPPSAMLMPIVLRDRVVAIVVAHRVHSDLKLADVTELLPLASAAADALGRLIVKHKSAGYRAPTENSGAVQIEAERIETKKIAKVDAQWRAPAPAERPSVPNLDGPELHMTAALPITEVLDQIEDSREGEAEEALDDAVERANETLGELAKRFPGKLRIDRVAVAGRPLRAMQYGGLLELVVRLGSAAGELLIEHMKSPQRDTRFYATVCASELRPRNAIFVLVERLFDLDFGVRDVAIEALSGYPLAELTQALAKARRSLHSDDPETVAAAATAVVQLGDVEAVPDLIGALERNNRGSEHARKALVALTAQDFGLSERKWRKWFETARKQHRVEWLIEGLSHKEDAIREASINDLRRLTGEYFGYHHDLPRKEREVAAERWASWWQETGMRRFGEREDERHRPTGVLPARKEPSGPER